MQVQVRKVLWQLFSLYPTPQALAAAEAKQVEQLIYPLGLMTKRAVAVIRFSQEYQDRQARDWLPTQSRGRSCVEMPLGCLCSTRLARPAAWNRGLLSARQCTLAEQPRSLPDAMRQALSSARGAQWTSPLQLHGIGQYAADAYFMFCRGQWEQVDPADKDLRKYHQWLRETGGQGSGLQREPCTPDQQLQRLAGEAGLPADAAEQQQHLPHGVAGQPAAPAQQPHQQLQGLAGEAGLPGDAAEQQQQHLPDVAGQQASPATGAAAEPSPAS